MIDGLRCPSEPMLMFANGPVIWFTSETIFSQSIMILGYILIFIYFVLSRNLNAAFPHCVPL